MRERRASLGMSQSVLARAVGVTFQQVQKYENASNRMGSSRLFQFARLLDVPVAYFFEQIPAGALPGRRRSTALAEEATPFQDDKDPMAHPETTALVRAYDKIREPRIRRRIYEMIRTVGAASHASRVGKRRKRPKAVR